MSPGPVKGQVSSLLRLWPADVVDSTSGLERIEVSLDGGASVTLPSDATGHTFLGLSDGAHAVTVRAIDRAGNVQTAIVRFAVDTFPLSPTGPYGLAPFVGLTAAVVAAVLVAVYLATRRRRREIPPL